jgi:gliding motility-associated-like protein
MIRIINIWILIFACLSIGVSSYGQQENVWVFGLNSGLSFNGATATAITTVMDGNEANASICDANGQLLFYTNGTTIWDRNLNVMPNGANIQTLIANVNSTSQGALIVPVPESSDRYYVFSLTEYATTNGSLFYSIVNMSLNNGLGDVEPGNKGIFIDSALNEQMTAVVGSNCNIWLLTASRQDTLKAFRIDYSGIDPNPVLSPLLVSRGNYDGIIGYMDASPNGQKLAVSRGNVSLYDFDQQTGQCSNMIKLDTNYYFYSVCFSPDNSKLYTANENGGLYQYDLSTGNPNAIVASRYLVSTATYFGQKRGPDGKIYLVHFVNGITTLKTIQQPNLAGAASSLGNGPVFVMGLKLGLTTVVAPHIYRDSLFTSTVVRGGCGNINLTLAPNNTGVNHTWNDGSSGASLAINTTGTYWVKYENACTRYTDTFEVIQDFIPLLFPELNSTASCKGDTNGRAWIRRVAGDTTAYACDWRNEQNVQLSASDTLAHVPAGVYTLRITSAYGCDTVLTLSVPEESYQASFTADTLVCAGDVIRYDNTSDPHFDVFSWTFGDGSSSGLGNPENSYPNSGSYNVMMIAKGNICKDTVHKTIIVDAPVAGIDFLKDRSELCTGEKVLLVPHLTDSTTMAGLHWDFGDGNSFTESQAAAMAHAFDQEGLMLVTLTGTFRACPERKYVDSVRVHPFPFVDLGVDTAICYGGSPLLLANLVPYQQGYRYRWNTGDTTFTLKVVHHGNYALSVTSDHGCITTEEIEVGKGCYMDIPNAFTPNGDGYNDFFFPRQLLSSRITGFYMKVFNRWGQVIFETTSKTGRGWDGKLNGTDQPGGVYLYLIEAGIDNKHIEKYQGNVTLIR